MTFLYSLVLFFLYWRTGRKDPTKNVGKSKGSGKGAEPGQGGSGGKKLQKHFQTFRVLVLVSAVVLLLAAPLTVFGITSIGQGAGSLVLWGLSLPAGWVGVSATALATLLLVIAVIVIVVDVLADWEVDKAAKNSLIILPLLALIAAGPIAMFMQHVNETIRTAATASISWAWRG